MILLQLNLTLRDNYVFVDPEAPLHLSLSKPRDLSPRLTASILRGLRGKTLIDVNGVVDLDTGLLKDQMKKAVEVGKLLDEADSNGELNQELINQETKHEMNEASQETTEGTQENIEETQVPEQEAKNAKKTTRKPAAK